MRSARQSLSICVLLSIYVTLSSTYTLHRKGTWPDTEELEEALKAIQERRRLIDDDAIGYGGLDFDDEDEDLEEEPLSWNRQDRGREFIDPDTMEYIRDMIYGTEDTMDNRGWADPDHESSDSEQDMNELKDILGDEDEEEENDEQEEEDQSTEEDKRIPPDMHKKEYDPSSLLEKKDISGGEIEPDKTTQNEIQEILEDEAEDALEKSLDKEPGGGEKEIEEDQEDDEENETDTNDELQDILDGDSDDVQPNIKDDELFPNIIAKEVALNKESYDESLPGYTSVKRKRSGSTPSIGEEEVEEAEEQLAEQNNFEPEDDSDSAREYIKQFLALEDDENTNLANALNLATLAQVRKTDSYIFDEADYIKRAIEDEQAIQMLKDELKQEVKADDRKRSDPETIQKVYKEEKDLDPELEAAIQSKERAALQSYMSAKLRQYLLRTGSALPSPNDISAYEDSLGKWFNGPVSDEEEGITEQDIALNPFLRELMERYYSGGVAKRGPAYVEDEFEPESEDDDDEDMDEATKSEIATVLKSYVQEMSPQQRLLLKQAVREKLQELEEEEEIQNEMEEEEGYCPALDVLDDCAAARNDGLHLDMEALYMCNRHQMCYTCGSSHGFSASHCDKGYRAEASRLCEHEADPKRCRQDSDVLLLDMVEAHIWVPFSEAPPVCSERCASEYILGIEDKKK